MGKKRKHELDADVERTMYSSFVSAANAVSQLYTQGVQQQRRAAAAASRATLEKVVSFVLRENSGSEDISKAALIHFLQQEYETVDTQEAPTPQPQMMMPFGPAASDDQQKSSRQLSASMAASPAGVAGPRSRASGMEEQHLGQQQHHQQQQQQQHGQQQAGADAMQMQHDMMQHMATSPFAGPLTGIPPPAMFLAHSENGMQ